MNAERMEKLLDAIRDKHIGVWGDQMLDRYVEVEDVRVNPEASTPDLLLSLETPRIYPGGAANAFNQLAHVCRDVTLYGGFRAGILKIRYVHNGQVIARVSEETRLEPLEPKLTTEDALLISDYHKGTVTPAAVAGLETSIPIVWDCKRFPMGGHGVTIKMNLPDSQRSGGGEIIATATCCDVVITRGPEPPIIYRPDGGSFHTCPQYMHLPHAFEVSGAGDAFAAFLTAFLAASISLEEAVTAAHICASAAGSSGRFRAPVLRSEILGVLEPHRRKLLAESEFDLWLKERCTGSVVITNGVFDLLHAGHVSLLQRCRRLGDHVIVLTNSDESAFRCKGRWPKIKAAERMRVLAAIDGVSAVREFHENTPVDLMWCISKTLGRKLSVLVKGEDSESPPGAELCERVELVPLVGDHTSDILRRVRESVP